MIRIQESNETKYEVFTDYVRITKKSWELEEEGLTEQEIIDAYTSQTDTDPESQGLFDTEAEAVKCAKKFNAVTRDRSGRNGVDLECHVVYVQEGEYDADDEYAGNSVSYVYFDCEEIEPETLDDEEEDVELKEDAEYPKPKTFSLEEVMKELGITEEDLAAVGDVEIE